MSVRRIARSGLLLVEHPAPVASTSALPSAACPACLPRRAASSVSLQPPLPAARAPSQGGEGKPSSSWAALSRVGQAIFHPAEGGPARAEPGVQAQPTSQAPALSAEASALIAELKSSRPEPNRVWVLFSQLELLGLTSSLPLVTLHSILPAIHVRPSKKHLDVDSATSRAHSYKLKADLILQRIVQAGGAVGVADHRALLAQYAAFSYGPGVCDAWDSMCALRPHQPPPGASTTTAFGALVRWIELHARTGGKALAQSAAQPLVLKAAAMLQQIKGDTARLDVALEPFFKILIAAKDFKVFAVAFRAVYGFDVRLPGAAVDAPVEVVAARRAMGEQEICWVLEMLAEVRDLSSMVAVFEVFDNPAPSPSAQDTFFLPSFQPEGEPAAVAQAGEAGAHLVGTRAFQIMIRTASWLGNGALARHYFNQLFWRWSIQTDQRLCAIEEAVGITLEDTRTIAAVHANSTAAPTKPAPAPAATEPAETTVSPPSFTAALLGHVRTWRPPTQAPAVNPYTQAPIVAALAARQTPPTAARPYALPSTVVRDVVHFAFANYDAATARFIRRRTLHVLRMMRDATTRISAVMDRLEPALLAGADGAPARSLQMLEREVALTSFHRLQLRYLLDVVKSDTNVVLAYGHLHKVQITHVARLKKLRQAIQDRAGVKERRAAAESKERQVLKARIEVVKQRLQRLYRAGRAHVGRTEFDRWNSELIRLKGLASGKGIQVEEEGEEVEAASA